MAREQDGVLLYIAIQYRRSVQFACIYSVKIPWLRAAPAHPGSPQASFCRDCCDHSHQDYWSSFAATYVVLSARIGIPNQTATPSSTSLLVLQ